MTSLTRLGLGGGTTIQATRRKGGPAGWAVLVALVALLVAVAQTALAVPQRIKLGDTCVGSIDAGAESFPFFGVAGTALRVSVKTGGGLATDVTVYGPDGAAVPSVTSTNSKGSSVMLVGTLSGSGDHRIVLEAKNNTAGTYRMRATGRMATTLSFDGDADEGVEQWFDFAAAKGTQVASITVRRIDATLSFDQVGILDDPAGAPIALAKNRASVKKLTASKGTLSSDGTYRFRFAPKGSGQWTAVVRLVAPKVVGASLQVPAGTIQLARSGAGVRVGVSTPPNGTNLVAGDTGWVAVVLNDDAGNALSLSQLATCNLYLYGPQDPLQTTTAVGLLRASVDRNAKPHHYIDLKTNTDVQTYGNVLLYPLSAVSNEAPGTYTASVWASLAADTTKQWFPVADVQIGTPTAETQVVEKANCAACHLGPVSGKFYMHHIDVNPLYFPNGNVAIDQWPTRTCKSCHNNDGYAAYDNKAGGADANLNRTPDPIVRRVHGVHMGEGNPSTVPGVGFPGLQLPSNIDPVTGDFKDYMHTVFPYDVRKCDKCHVDDRWKTSPSRMACGACHDATWFGNPAQTPIGMTNHSGNAQTTEQTSDANCLTCHDDGALSPIAAKHGVGPTAPWVLNTVDVSMTPPANGTYYTAADDAVGVTITLAIRTDANTAGTVIDHTLVNDTNFSAANLFVHGPRARSVPALTNAAINGDSKKRASVTNAKAATGSPAAWTFAATDTFKFAINGGAPVTLTVPGTTVTPAQVVTWLNGYFTANTVSAVASVSSVTKVKIDSTVQNWQGSEIDIYDCPVTTVMGWKPLPYAGATGSASIGTTMEPYVKVGAGSYPNVDVRRILSPNAFDWYEQSQLPTPAVAWSTANITYKLNGSFANLVPGTYCVYFYCLPNAGKVAGLANKCAIGFMTFQVGSATPEKKVATNCADCHGTTIWHLYEGPIHPQPFDTDYCKACHDYSHYETGNAFVNQGGTSTNGWSGFGAVPIARRVHGVHRGLYLEHPEEIYSNGDPFGEIIFPMDIRNCTKCHSETDTWKQKPSRVACMSCHDTDAAKSHGAVMTYIGNLMDPYGTSAQESCAVCHGEGAEFAVSKVHAIANPFVPPYPREKEK